nr:MAG: spike protein [Pekapeka alphacoronavirus 1]WPA70778.1 MAG: spike protein [Pekapeka alphacoronavirus 2]
MWVFQPLSQLQLNMRYLLPYFLATASLCFVLPVLSNPRCGDPLTLNRFFTQLGIQFPSVTVVGGYLPNVTGHWHCTGHANHSGVHGIFMSYYSHAQAFSLGISQETYDPNGYQMYVYRQHSGTADAKAVIRICKFPKQALSTSQPGATAGTQCLVDKWVPMTYPGYPNNSDIVYGVSWDLDTVSIYAGKLYRFSVPNNRWSQVNTWCQNGKSCAFQYVFQPTYYTLNVTSAGKAGIEYEDCTEDCQGLADNVFATATNGYIPDTFSFSNWFLLTNSSTLVQGRVVSEQPLLVTCLWPIPKLVGVSQVISFNNTMSDVCNGATTHAPPDAIRFNVNDSSVLLADDAFIMATTLGYNVSFLCSNSSERPTVATFNVVTDDRRYCFLKYQNGQGNTTTRFLAVVPPNIKEVVITKFGNVYLNGYGYLHLGPLEKVYINVQGTSSDVSGFWTIAGTRFTQAMIEVNGTNIQRILYCDTPLRSVKCSQLSFDLPDGFYPLPSTYGSDPPVSFVTLPSFNDHSYLNINVSSRFRQIHTPGSNRLAEYQLVSANTTIHGSDSFCVQSRQVTIKLNHNSTYENVDNYNYWTGTSSASECPFTVDGFNEYLSFASVCLSLTPLPGSCSIKFFLSPQAVSPIYVSTVYFKTTPGDIITGTPKPLEGLTDISFVSLNVCTSYTIYGFKGEGVITESGEQYLAGIYYTSLSGQLLAFKNVTSGIVYSVMPCSFAQQAALIDDDIVGVITSVSNSSDLGISFNTTRELPGFYYHTHDADNCTEPMLVYSNIGVCKSGAIGVVLPKQAQPKVQPMFEGNVSVPTNFSMSLRTEYIQLYNTPVSIDCAMYVCNGNLRCKQLLVQYTSACKTIESALQLSAKLESMEVNEMLTVSADALQLATIEQFQGGGYNLTNVLGNTYSSRSLVEDILFDKVVTNGLGTVDEDYKACSNGLSIADLACAQYYNGIMVLPGVVDAEKLHMYSASLIGGMVLGGITSAASLPFSYAVQARLNYVALQTDVLQRNQQILAESFNNAMGNITLAFQSVNDAIEQTSQGLQTVAEALTKVQDVVNMQGNALAQLTVQLQNNFQAISSSISDIYSRLDQLSADAQVDRLITGRLAALNAFVSQALTKYAEVQASRQLAKQKVNECVKSQSTRFGFCGGDGEHIFSITQAAPHGLIFLHAVLVPGEYVNVTAVSGLCVAKKFAMTVRSTGLLLFSNGSGSYYITPRKMYEPRVPQVTDFVQIQSCQLSYVNVTNDQLPDIIPDYIDVNKTLDDLLAELPNATVPEFPLDIFNQTYLNLTGEIADLEQRSESLKNTTEELKQLINNINSTLVDLEWLNRVETYIKWPWWVWLIIVIVLIFVVSLLVFCCISTGCCGCCGCCGACFGGCKGPRLQPYEQFEKVHIQ